jgi:hypothetical protein
VEQGIYWQLRLEQMQFGFSASRDQGKAFGTVARENGIQLAGAFPDFIVRNRISLKVSNFDQALGEIPHPIESDGEPAGVKLNAACFAIGIFGVNSQLSHHLPRRGDDLNQGGRSTMQEVDIAIRASGNIGLGQHERVSPGHAVESVFLIAPLRFLARVVVLGLKNLLYQPPIGGKHARKRSAQMVPGFSK